MNVTKLYRVVPFTLLTKSRGEVLISADSTMAAPEQARATLGEKVALDLCEGNRTVPTYCHAQRWGAVESVPQPV